MLRIDTCVQKTSNTYYCNFKKKVNWLFKNIINDDINIFLTLKELGKLHLKYNIDINYFNVLIISLHKIFEEYFIEYFKINIKIGLDIVLSQIISVMFLKNNNNTIANNREILITKDNHKIIKNINNCISLDIGREYLFYFLKQIGSDEIPYFLNLYLKYNNQNNTNIIKFNIIKLILNNCVSIDSEHQLNISHECREKVMFFDTFTFTFFFFFCK